MQRDKSAVGRLNLTKKYLPIKRKGPSDKSFNKYTIVRLQTLKLTQSNIL